MPVNSLTLAAHHFDCTAENPVCDTIVLLHGWGSNSNSWQSIIPALQKISNVIAIDLPGFGASPAIENFALEPVLELIAEHLPDKVVIIGWSFGGMLAVQLAARYPQKISRLVTLASNVKFIASRDYETAMSMAVNRQFVKGFEQAPEDTLKLFGGLMAQGDVNDRVLLKKMRNSSTPETINANWLQALQVLAQLDNREVFSQLVQSGLHLLGEADVLVPAGAAQSLATLNKKQSVKLLPATAHAVHWSQPELVAQMIAAFLVESASIPLDKKRIAQSFSRAAHTYDSVANLQRSVGEKLLQQVQTSFTESVVLDLGCGTGHFTPLVQDKFPQAKIVGVDIAEGMLQFARERNSQDFIWLCADAEHLPFANNSVQVIFSSLALQWCTSVPDLFAEINRILAPGGQLIFSSLGPKTLHELKSAWQEVDNYVHVNRFHESQLLLDTLTSNDFSIIHFEQTSTVSQFEKLTDLTRSLKALGAHNVNSGQAPGLNGRKKLEAFKRAYEDFRSDGFLPATYDVIYIIAKKTR
jgi:malonyl-CoA O-methyltransferase